MRILLSLSGHTVSIIINLSSFLIVRNLFVSIQASILMPLQGILSKSFKPCCKYLRKFHFIFYCYRHEFVHFNFGLSFRPSDSGCQLKCGQAVHHTLLGPVILYVN